MKKITILIIVAIILIVTIALIINANNTTDKMQIKPFTLTKISATVVIKNKKAYSMGDDFKIEQKIENQWKEVQFLKVEKLEDMATFASSATKVEKNSSTEIKLDWTKMYGELKRGNYRVVKEISSEDGKKELYAEFKI